MSSPPPSPRPARAQLSSAPAPPPLPNLDFLSFDQPARRPIPDQYKPVAREPSGRSYPSVQGNEASALQFGTRPDGSRYISNIQALPGAHDRLYEPRKPEAEDSDSSSSWGSDAEDPEARYQEEKKQTRIRRRYTNHHRQSFHDGDPLQRRLSYPDKDPMPARGDTPEPSHAGELTPRPRSPAGEVLRSHQINLVHRIREEVANTPIDRVTEQQMTQLHRARIPHDWALRDRPHVRDAHEALQRRGLQRDQSRLDEAEASRKRRQSMDQSERVEDRKRRGSDASR